MTVHLVLSLPKIIGIQLVDYSFLDFCVLRPFLVDYPREGENSQSYPTADLCREMFVNVLYKAFCLLTHPHIQIFSVVRQLEEDFLGLIGCLFGVALQYGPGELVAKQLVNLQDGFLDDRQLLDFKSALCEFSLFWASSRQFLSLGLADSLQVFLLEVMLVLDVGIGSGIGEVALAAAAGEVSALVVLPLATRVLQAVHLAINYYKGTAIEPFLVRRMIIVVKSGFVGDYLVELLEGHEAVVVGVCLLHHLLEIDLLERHVQVLGDPPQTEEADVACLFVIEESEELPQLFLRFLASDALVEEEQKVVEIDPALSFLVQIADQLIEWSCHCLFTLLFKRAFEIYIMAFAPFGLILPVWLGSKRSKTALIYSTSWMLSPGLTYLASGDSGSTTTTALFFIIYKTKYILLNHLTSNLTQSTSPFSPTFLPPIFNQYSHQYSHQFQPIPTQSQK